MTVINTSRNPGSAESTQDLGVLSIVADLTNAGLTIILFQGAIAAFQAIAQFAAFSSSLDSNA